MDQLSQLGIELPSMAYIIKANTSASWAASVVVSI